MSFISVLRDGENVGEAVVQRMNHAPYQLELCPVTPGVGTGYSAGVVGRMNGASGANPNHFSVQANGSNLVITIQPGWAWIVKDNGASTYDPKVVYLLMNAATTFTLAGNSQGTSRTDTICIRFDQTVAPDAQGTNLPSIVQVQGGASNALGNAPSDGALYLPLANIVIASGAASVSQSNVTDKRFVHPEQARAMVYASTGGQTLTANTFTSPAFDTIITDTAGMYTTSAAISTTGGSGARYTAPLPGRYRISAYWETSGAVADGVQCLLGIFRNTGEAKRGSRPQAGSASNSLGAGGSGDMQMNYGDTAQAFAYTSASGATFAAGATTMYFDIQWVAWS